uniref:Sku5-like 5 n=1 Tax=Brassica campestris TaxID=3711 RepID=A8IXR7_BRACM|nr:Sku5-like 5 [Brassica rapa]
MSTQSPRTLFFAVELVVVAPDHFERWRDKRDGQQYQLIRCGRVFSCFIHSSFC